MTIYGMLRHGRQSPEKQKDQGKCGNHKSTPLDASDERDGWRVAELEYAVGSVPLSYVMVPSEESSSAEPARFRHVRRGDFGVVSWHERGVLHVLVGDFTDAELARLARACVAQRDLPRA